MYVRRLTTFSRPVQVPAAVPGIQTDRFEEMAEDEPILPDIEMAIAHGRIHRRFTKTRVARARKSLARP